ncbi:hypothetical protein VNO78_22009 [Psophocarpus tetragonolobus]|uniref:Zeta toxin domain-containing protein n=1 Tax=Psophocarpus tetragonolobus TaxID=3891 RepID=A0AAN9SG63_PSOTE
MSFPHDFHKYPSKNQMEQQRPVSCKKLMACVMSLGLGTIQSNGKLTFTQIAVASSIGLIFAVAMHYRLKKLKDRKIIPHLRMSKLGKWGSKTGKVVLTFVNGLLRRKSEGCEDDLYAFFENEPDADSLFVKLVEEFERCILSYFAFHWSHGDVLISQVLSSEVEPKAKLRHIVMATTREQRFERVTKNLKVAKVFNTLVEEMKAMGLVTNDYSRCTEVMAPVAHSDRSPVLLFMGGGLGAGKSTVLKDILKEPFWAGAAGNAVIIEADAFKESDVIYKALSSRGHQDMIRTAELVHQSSTDAASSLLVTELNEGGDVIMDGTLSWLPFVVQTITMARNVHCRRYRMGPGYKLNDDGSVTENYWQRIEEEEPDKLVDNARLYSTNSLEGPPKDGKIETRHCSLIQMKLDCLKRVARLNEKANNIYELYKHPNPTCEAGSIWKDIVLSPSRLNIQKELKYSIQKEPMRRGKPHLLLFTYLSKAENSTWLWPKQQALSTYFVVTFAAQLVMLS